jgi:hypothetical protein
MNGFTLLKPRGYTPRLTIDQMVAAHESWAIASADIEWPRGKSLVELLARSICRTIRRLGTKPAFQRFRTGI